MKKIKLLAPILTTVGTIGVITPILTSCNKESNVNKVVLQEGQKLERTVTGGSGTLAFYFKQENAKNPEDTKVYLKDFSINSVSGLSAPDKTIKFNADSAGNMRVTIDVRSIYENWNYVETISCTLVFRNKTAGTEYEVGPIVITIPEEGSAAEATAEDSAASSGLTVLVDGQFCEFSQEYSGFNNQTTLISVVLPEDESKFMPLIIGVSQNDVPLTEGVDYIYFTDGAKTGYIWIPNTKDDEGNITIDIPTGDKEAPSRALIPFKCSDSSCQFLNNVMIIGENDIVQSAVGTDDIKTSSISAQICGYKNDFEWFSDPLCSDKTMNQFVTYMEDEYIEELLADSVDQELSYILIQYDVVMNDNTAYYGSCAIQVEKDSGIGEVVEPDIHND